MTVIRRIMLDEWRHWQRTRLGITVLYIGLLISLAAVVVNTLDMQKAAAERTRLQETSEATFLDQPDRHPHRMVHYGHYVFRAPSPLSVVEPGVDAYTGTSIFLEGHRQNSATFSRQRQASGVTRFSSLSPGFLLQTLLPLLVLVVGSAGLTREREAGTLAILLVQGVRPAQLFAGKFLALLTASILLFVPAILALIWATIAGESPVVSVGFLLGYLAYLAVWAGIVVAVSACSTSSRGSLGILLAIWIGLCILVPRVGSSTAAALAPSSGKLETDFAVLEELRKLADGHNASDPAFEKLKTGLLAKFEVETVEQLPINFRGVVAEYSEQKLTRVLNEFAEARMAEELAQAKIARQFGWASPMVAVRSFAMALAGSNLETHHRFLREAEELRFDFVQSLNRAHKDHLDYTTDVNRYKSEAAGQAARVHARHWSALSSFSFQVDDGRTRLKDSTLFAAQLALWCLLAFAILYTLRGRVTR